MIIRFEPFYTWYYCFAWWSFIIFIESLLCLRGGKSLAFEDPGKFFLLPCPSRCGFFFEAFNFRMSNWHYFNIPSNTVIGKTGSASIQQFCRQYFRPTLSIYGHIKLNGPPSRSSTDLQDVHPYPGAVSDFLPTSFLAKVVFPPGVVRFHIPAGACKSQLWSLLPSAGMGKGVAAELISAPCPPVAFAVFYGSYGIFGQGRNGYSACLTLAFSRSSKCLC